MSFISGTQTELFYTQKATATNLNTFTAEDNLQKTLPPVIIPRGFFAAYGEGTNIKVSARGRLGTTGTPTFTFTIRILTSTTWSAGGVGFASNAITAGNGVTLAPWKLDCDIIMRTLSIAAASTVAVMGDIAGGRAFGNTGGTIPDNNVAFTTTTYDDSIDHYLFLSAACSVSNALNLIQLEMLKVYGEN